MILSIHPFNIIAVWYRQTHTPHTIKRKERCQYVWFSAMNPFCINVANVQWLLVCTRYSPNWTLLPILCVFSRCVRLWSTFFATISSTTLSYTIHCIFRIGKRITFLLAHFIRQLNIITGEYNNNKILLRLVHSIDYICKFKFNVRGSIC